MKIYCLLIFFLLFAGFGLGQTSGNNTKKSDSSSLLTAFKKGKTEGHFRLFFMQTDNDGPLTDYHALAFGGGLKYQTKSFRGFQLGVGGFYIWNLASSDLSKPDPITNTMSRYETGQFDQTDLKNKNNLQRLEDFFIRYNYKNSFIRFGKQVIKTPFINPQDGRMRPTGEQGVWAEVNEIKKLKVELGWLSHISPRGTMKWYRGASSMGIYPSGFTINGSPGNYKNNLQSKGIAIAGITYSPETTVRLQFWNHWVQNIFNTLLLQAEADFAATKNEKFIAGIQIAHQSAVKDGGNEDAAKTYFDPSQSATIISARVGYVKKKTTTRINYSRITSQGRFLFPREWGREPFYTFLPRERNEGLGDVHAFTINFVRNFFEKKLTTDFSAGYYHLPDVKNYSLNKYGLPSYFQFNADIRYSFDGFLKGLNAELLYLYKRGHGNTYNDRKNTINKVDMHQLNLILNYVF